MIYPLLPEGAFGPYQFLEPRRIWLFVILVSSVSYAGYFVEKFMGARRGLKLVAVFGGLASTTAATTSFARSCKEVPGKQGLYGQASVVANAIQFPRVLIILALVSPLLAQAAAAPLLVMMAAGLVFGLVFLRGTAAEPPSPSAGLRNPFRLLPALKFGAIFTAILLVTKMAASLFGSDTIYWTSTLGGMLDVDAVSLSLAELLAQGRVTVAVSLLSIFLALLMNAVVKTAIAAYAGTAAFAWRTASGFAVMFGAGAGAWLLMNLGMR